MPKGKTGLCVPSSPWHSRQEKLKNCISQSLLLFTQSEARVLVQLLMELCWVQRAWEEIQVTKLQLFLQESIFFLQLITKTLKLGWLFKGLLLLDHTLLDLKKERGRFCNDKWCLRQDGTERNWFHSFTLLQHKSALATSSLCPAHGARYVFLYCWFSKLRATFLKTNFSITPHLYGLSNFIQEAESWQGRLNRLYLKVQRLWGTHPQNKSLFHTPVGMALLNAE